MVIKIISRRENLSHLTTDWYLVPTPCSPNKRKPERNTGVWKRFMFKALGFFSIRAYDALPSRFIDERLKRVFTVNTDQILAESIFFIRCVAKTKTTPNAFNSQPRLWENIKYVCIHIQVGTYFKICRSKQGAPRGPRLYVPRLFVLARFQHERNVFCGP